MKKFNMKLDAAFTIDKEGRLGYWHDSSHYILESGRGSAATHLLSFCTASLLGYKTTLFLWSSGHNKEGNYIALAVRAFSPTNSRWTSPLTIFEFREGDQVVRTALGVMRTALLRELLAGTMPPFSVTLPGNVVVTPVPQGGVVIMAGGETIHWSSLQVDRVIRAMGLALEMYGTNVETDQPVRPAAKGSKKQEDENNKFYFALPEAEFYIARSQSNSTASVLRFKNYKVSDVKVEDMIRLLDCLVVACHNDDSELSLPIAGGGKMEHVASLC